MNQLVVGKQSDLLVEGQHQLSLENVHKIFCFQKTSQRTLSLQENPLLNLHYIDKLLMSLQLLMRYR